MTSLIGDLAQAKLWHQRQLDVALATKDKVAEGRACSNLGIVYQLLGEHDAALKLHQAHLGIARSLGDKAGMGRAYGNIGNAYNALGYYEQAIKYHKQELTISKEVRTFQNENIIILTKSSINDLLFISFRSMIVVQKLVHMEI